MPFLFGYNPTTDGDNLFGASDECWTDVVTNNNGGTAEGVAFEFANGASRTVRALLYDADGNLLASGSASFTTAGVKQIPFDTPVAVDAAADYRFGIQIGGSSNMLLMSNSGATIQFDRNLTAYSSGAPDPWATDNSGSEDEPVLYVYGATGDSTAPTFESGPSSANVGETSFDVNATLNEDGTIYGVVVADGASAPTSAEVKAGQASGGGSPIDSDNTAATASVQATLTFNVGLSAGTPYDAYIVAEDDETTPNLQSSPTKVDVTTASASQMMLYRRRR